MKTKISSYLELTKPRILMLVLVTTVLGFYLGGKGMGSYSVLLWLLLGTSCTCAGASTLNHYFEREFDSLMNRTKDRPIPSGQITPQNALLFGFFLVLIGEFILYVEVNILTAFLSLVTVFLYIMIYTPLKRVSWLNTTIGAFPGAMPPLGGWAAATGTLNLDAGILFLILFLWQHPHFYAIAWMCKDDYKKGGFKMLPVVEPDGKKMFDHIRFYSYILIPVSLLPVWSGLSGWVYFTGVLLAGLMVLYTSEVFIKSRSLMDAKNLLRATVVYLPILLILIVMDVNF